VRLIHQFRGRTGMLGSHATRHARHRERPTYRDGKTFAEEWRWLVSFAIYRVMGYNKIRSSDHRSRPDE
jgi:hypothetical protein